MFNGDIKLILEKEKEKNWTMFLRRYKTDFSEEKFTSTMFSCIF